MMPNDPGGRNFQEDQKNFHTYPTENAEPVLTGVEAASRKDAGGFAERPLPFL
jgi:hypothetical protein